VDGYLILDKKNKFEILKMIKVTERKMSKKYQSSIYLTCNLIARYITHYQSDIINVFKKDKNDC